MLSKMDERQSDNIDLQSLEMLRNSCNMSLTWVYVNKVESSQEFVLVNTHNVSINPKAQQAQLDVQESLKTSSRILFRLLIEWVYKSYLVEHNIPLKSAIIIPVIFSATRFNLTLNSAAVRVLRVRCSLSKVFITETMLSHCAQ